MLVLMLGRGRGEAPEQGGATHAAAGAADTVAYGASFHGLLFQRAMGGSAWPGSTSDRREGVQGGREGGRVE